ncbi:Xaa-Pro aminopeptidase [Thermoanaerobacter thermohydrosulfuricus]|uniref:Xaa-Pro aminopeptidase n=2 Tax=Thermoanaerobacter thermohydrosulfuricus TaxID=1516 RepID=M8D1E7_THETY|nr:MULTISPECIES: aminopeptidase P family protein [Thermoanaerobacter]EMT40394.1 Xaa-Pro aminopeptidase [Thermoanaerobacter thermohydrosulfuricus WC1]SDE99264.1 Xaa-Pro aminopeptidase [Thermoanaerobacter thermohydrosulfuricus]SFE70824.1 Xaa-Pro aminopeptidase [Thermoanaerobacter thermohydrosulfuricus]
MNKRLQNLRELMKEKDIEAFVIYKFVNVTYITGFTGDDSVALVTHDKAIFITDGRYTEQAQKEVKDFEVIEHKTGIKEVLKEYIKTLEIKKLAFEENISYGQYRELKEHLEIELIPQANLVETLRMVKDEEEIENIKKAQNITDRAFEHLLKFIKVGMTEKEVALELEYFMKKQGAEDLSFDTIVASGKRSSLPHGKASEKVIEKGDFVTIDFGCKVGGYCSDMTRTIVIGKASEKQKEIYNIVLEAQQKAIDNIRAGITSKEADLLARSVIEEKGYGQYFSHSLGHGVGLEVHEAPSLSFKKEEILKEGAIVTVEPGIYIPDFGGVRIEDMVLLKEDGVINLTKSPKYLIELN